MEEMKIIQARKQDAPLIAYSIMAGIGEEICRNLAGADHTLDDVKALFTQLAESSDSQYSYLNTLVAIDDDGTPMGACISYDGANLHQLRKAFFELAAEKLDLHIENMDDETDSGEFYIDTLAVLPDYRGQGVAAALLMASVDKAAASGKPAGLLVDKDNHRARRLYDKLGFKQVGERPFAFVMMDHLQYSKQ